MWPFAVLYAVSRLVYNIFYVRKALLCKNIERPTKTHHASLLQLRSSKHFELFLKQSMNHGHCLICTETHGQKKIFDVAAVPNVMFFLVKNNSTL